MVQQKGDLKLKKYLFIAFYSRISGFNNLFSVRIQANNGILVAKVKPVG